MVKNLPTQYIFFLLCCYDAGCPHPVCQSGPPALPYRWYPDGPLLTELPLPVYDPERQWGSTCSSCSGVCSGHYKSVVFTDVSDIATTAQPPSSILKQQTRKEIFAGKVPPFPRVGHINQTCYPAGTPRISALFHHTLDSIPPITAHLHTYNFQIAISVHLRFQSHQVNNSSSYPNAI